MCQVPDQVDFDRPDDVIRFIVDNNPEAVRNNFSRYGINQGGLTPCMMKDKLIAMLNAGYDIRNLIRVPVNSNASNYTAEIISAARADGSAKVTWGDVGDILAGLGTGIGAILNPPSQPIVMPSAPTVNYTPYIIGGVAIVAVLILVLFLKK